MMNKFLKYLFLLILMHKSPCLSAQDKHEIDSLQSLIKSTHNDTTKISALILLSKNYLESSLPEAFEYGKKALALSIQLNYPPKIGYAHNVLGDIYWYKGDFGLSSDHYFRALRIFETLKYKAAIADCYRNIGWVYDQQKNYTEALNYYNKSLSANIELNRKKHVGLNYADIGIILAELKKYDDAIDSYQKALKIFEGSDNQKGTATIYGNMGIVYDKIGKTSLAVESIEKSIKIAEKYSNIEYLSTDYNILGEHYMGIKKYSEANAALEKALKFAKETGYNNLIQSVYQNFVLLYEKQNDFHKAFEFAQLSSALKDSINLESNNKQAKEMTTKYESEKKELMINSLEKDKESEKYFRIYLILFCALIAAFAIVLFRGNVRKRNANRELSFAYTEIELKNRDITDSINYSKRIQDAILPSLELKHKLFPASFILFKPKDIVSGDFYWFNHSPSNSLNEHGEKRIIACCDCTGHGVPGALMSMIGNNILNQIVNEKGITSPAEILNQLHKEVRKALKQEGKSATRDGMDIALVTFTSETEIVYAGAQRPLWIVRPQPPIGEQAAHQTLSTDQNAIIEELKADKISIGGLQSETERKFTEHKISLNKGDTIYIFSDGFVDQFGGTEGKKFMTKNFKQLLLTIHSKPMTEQESIINRTLKEWKGNRDQIDDILIIGIRI